MRSDRALTPESFRPHLLERHWRYWVSAARPGLSYSTGSTVTPATNAKSALERSMGDTPLFCWMKSHDLGVLFPIRNHEVIVTRRRGRVECDRTCERHVDLKTVVSIATRQSPVNAAVLTCTNKVVLHIRRILRRVSRWFCLVLLSGLFQYRMHWCLLSIQAVGLNLLRNFKVQRLN